MIQESYVPNEKPLQPLAVASQQLSWRSTTHKAMLLHLAFAYANRSDWALAAQNIKLLQRAIRADAEPTPEPVQTAAMYLTGVIRQAAGDLESAMQCLDNPQLALRPTTLKSFDATHDFRLLAALNRIPILRHTEAGRAEAEVLLNTVEPLCAAHPDRSFLGAYYLLRATSPTDLGVVKTKNFLQLALKMAKQVSNDQISAIAINLMTALFFENIVADQAEKCARTGRQLAKGIRSPLWVAVAGNMLGRNLQSAGKEEEAALILSEAHSQMENCAPPLQRRFAVIEEQE